MNFQIDLIRWLGYEALCLVADALDTIMSTLFSNSRPCISFQPSDIETLDDKELLELQLKAPKVHPKYGVVRLTPRTVAKISQDVDDYMSDASEANVLNLVFAQTTIPVPRVRRVVELGDYMYLIVEDYIEGPSLAEVWSTYTIWQKIGIAFTLRGYVRQLRRLKASPTTPPGPMGVDGPRTCDSPPIFGPIRPHQGPFASYAELTSFFNQKAEKAYRYQKFPDDHPSRKERFDDSEAMVLTHQDINPRNIIVDKDGRLWMIDWGWAGYYPPWFEFVAMRRQLENEESMQSYYPCWDLMIPFVCGPCFEQERWLNNMAMALNYG